LLESCKTPPASVTLGDRGRSHRPARQRQVGNGRL